MPPCAEAQLEADVEMIKSINADRKYFNDTIMRIAKDATGKDLGSTPEEWRLRPRRGQQLVQTTRPGPGEADLRRADPVRL